MKVLVTGGAGFIGSHLAQALLQRGDEVAVIDDFNDYYDPALKRKNLDAVRESGEVTLYEGDIRDARFVRDAAGEFSPDAVCHLAARVGVRPSIEDPLLYEQVNCVGTLNLLEAVRAACRPLKNFVFASSSSVYGVASRVPFSEDDPVGRPISPYAATKRAGELMLHTYSHLSGLPVTCLRLFTVYGERGRPDMAVALFTKAIWEGSPLSLFGDGTAKRDFTYVGDIIRGFVAALDNPVPYEIINIGGSDTVEVQRLIEIIEKKLDRKAKVNRMDTQPGDVPITYADVSKAARLLGYEPAVSIEEGASKYVDWFLSVVNRGGTVAGDDKRRVD